MLLFYFTGTDYDWTASYYLWRTGNLINYSVNLLADALYSLTAADIPSNTKGDVNGDIQVTIVDALFIAQYTVDLRTFTPSQLTVTDVNCDRKVNIVDALFIAQYTVGLRQTFG